MQDFKDILLKEVDQHWYEEIYNTMIKEYEVEPGEPDKLTDEEVKEERIKMYRKITAEFRSGWYAGKPDAPDFW